MILEENFFPSEQRRQSNASHVAEGFQSFVSLHKSYSHCYALPFGYSFLCSSYRPNRTGALFPANGTPDCKTTP